MKLSTRLFTGLALMTILITTSCTRDFICQCEIAYSGRPGLPDTLINEYKLTDTEKKAKKICEEGSTSSEEEGITTVETCKLF